MRFNSLEQILTQLEKQPGWEKFKEYRQLLKCWNNAVNQQTGKHTRPLYITRQILWVATSSATRAQELSFQRYTLLKRLNQQLPFTLKDIRFSSSGWHQKTYQVENKANIFKIRRQDQSKAGIPLALKSSEKTLETQDQSEANQAKQAAQRWLKTLEQVNPALISCPNCQALTPKGEIERWDLCHHCVAQKWSEEYRPATFPKSK